MRQKSQAFQLQQKESALLVEVKKHPDLGAYAAVELECVLTKSITNFTGRLAPGQEKLLRELAKARGVTLPC